MSKRMMNLRNHSGDDDVRISRMNGRDTGFGVQLPSPFLLAIVVVFVVLPLVWPENADETAIPKPLDAFELSYDVKSLDISFDGQSVAATCRDRPIDVWVRGREPAWKFFLLPKHRLNGSRCLAFSPKGTILAVGNVDGTVTLWDVASRQEQANLDAGTETVSALAFSPDGALLVAAGADSRVRLWDVPGDRLRASWEGHRGPVTARGLLPTAGTWHRGGKITPCRSGMWHSSAHLLSSEGTPTSFSPWPFPQMVEWWPRHRLPITKFACGMLRQGRVDGASAVLHRPRKPSLAWPLHRQIVTPLSRETSTAS
jgi:WD40 repeat protein